MLLKLLIYIFFYNIHRPLRKDSYSQQSINFVKQLLLTIAKCEFGPLKDPIQFTNPQSNPIQLPTTQDRFKLAAIHNPIHNPNEASTSSHRLAISYSFHYCYTTYSTCHHYPLPVPQPPAMELHLCTTTPFSHQKHALTHRDPPYTKPLHLPNPPQHCSLHYFEETLTNTNRSYCAYNYAMVTELGDKKDELLRWKWANG